jgi:hypothetical protein
MIYSNGDFEEFNKRHISSIVGKIKGSQQGMMKYFRHLNYKIRYCPLCLKNQGEGVVIRT